MSLYDTAKSDLSDIILNTDDFAESVTHTAASDGTETSLTALVVREGLDVFRDERGENDRQMARVGIATDDLSAVSVGDTLSFPVVRGGTSADWAVVDYQREGAAWNVAAQRISTAQHVSGNYRTGENA